MKITINKTRVAELGAPRTGNPNPPPTVFICR
jgi:hypothetical protein